METEYQKLLEKYLRLKEENEQLRSQLKIKPTKDDTENRNSENQIPSVNQFSSAEDKIKLFLALFAGRTDVYAKRWVSKRTGKSGYSPTCKNEWDDKLCQKGRIKCSDCPNRVYNELTSKEIYKHLSKNATENDVVGIYPMLKDETTNFIVIDFDDENWQQDVTTISQSCNTLGVPVYIERSRSGEGAHCWFFFSEPVQVKLARRFASSVISYSMNQNHKMKFSSYDRLLPNQDNMPDGGFGNLIALPLQGFARKNDNSLFIDETFKPYKDQWQFLSSVKKISSEDISVYMSKLRSYDGVGYLGLDETEEKPWQQKSTEIKLKSTDVPSKVELIISNMIYINKSGFSHSALNKIKRLAAFKNPEYYKKQAMRFSVYGTPRIISTAEDYDEYIALPRGCFDAVVDLLIQLGVECSFKNECQKGNSVDVVFDGELRENQSDAAKSMLLHSNGILSATTAFGKTVVGSYLISQKKVNTLILVHNSALLEQWKKSLEAFLVFTGEKPTYTTKTGRVKSRDFIGQLSGNKNTLNGIVDIAIMQSVVSGGDVKDFVKNYGMVIVDECHHVPAVSFEKILKEVSAELVYGLTATPKRKDGHQPIIFMQCGPIRYRSTAAEQALKSGFDHFITPRFTRLRIAQKENEKTGINEIYSTVVESEVRNSMVVNDVVSAFNENRYSIVLTERYEHALNLYTELSKQVSNVFLLTGRGTVKEKREALEKIKQVPDGTPFIIVATGKYIGEGFDEPRLDTLFLAMPIAWQGTLAQYAGRLHRKCDGKTEVRIYDYVDIFVDVLERMYFKRLKGYAELGYRVKDFVENNTEPGIIFDRNNFSKVFSQDLQSVRHEAVIVSPFLKKSRIMQITTMLAQARADGVKITVVTRCPEDYNDDESQRIKENINLLHKCGINVVTQSMIHQKYAILDGKTVWYGSINLLSFGTSQETMMRLQNREIAETLLAEVDNISNPKLY